MHSQNAYINQVLLLHSRPEGDVRNKIKRLGFHCGSSIHILWGWKVGRKHLGHRYCNYQLNNVGNHFENHHNMHVQPERAKCVWNKVMI